MMAHMRRLSPDLADWILWEGYGKVLGRPRLSARLRELCVIPVLAITGALPQLRAHIRGALNLGATPPEVRRALAQARPWVPVALDRTVATMRDSLLVQSSPRAGEYRSRSKDVERRGPSRTRESCGAGQERMTEPLVARRGDSGDFGGATSVRRGTRTDD
jgi:alkylhydroperoxidase/carboxymuconolactone decarboxylase family protein YurZ